MMKLIFYIFLLMLNILFIDKILMFWFFYVMLLVLNFIFMNSLNYNIYWMNCSNWMGLDFLSLSLVILSIWVISLMFLVSKKMFIQNIYSFILLLLLLMLVLSFISLNYFLFYIFFEVSLIPTFLLIMGWGYQPERINASMSMILYTLFASLPMLILLFYVFDYFNSLNYLIILNKELNMNFNLDFIIYFYMILAFLVKLPMFLFHMWLPKAHIEAPVTGSMILAGVMLKLGGYGIMRSLIMMMNYSMKYNYLFILVSLVGMIYVSLICLRVTDIKLIVAYSSVVHMGVMLLGLFSLSVWGYIGGMLMMLAHGLCSSAMFMMVNFIYEVSKTRNILINKGLVYLMPALVMWWFLFCMANMSAPISLNLVSELMILNVMINWSMNLLVFLIFSLYFSACYSLYLFSYVSHGSIYSGVSKVFSKSLISYLPMLMHWIPLNFLILKLEIFI